MEVLVVILSCLLAALIAAVWYLLTKTSKNSQPVELIETLRSRIEELTTDLNSKSRQLEEKNEALTTAASEREVLRSQYDNCVREIAALKEKHESDVNTLIKNYNKQITDVEAGGREKANEIKNVYERMLSQQKDNYETQINGIKENLENQLSQLQEANNKQVQAQLSLIREQMKTTSEEVLRKRQTELEEHNVGEVSKIINPLMDSIKGMQEAFDKSKEKQNETFARLDETIRLNSQKSETLGQTADRLARALTGQVKAQGNFGELKLRQLLEDMELHEGEQYFTQETLRDSSGKRAVGDDGKGLIPDFILKFPQERYVVIDAKMSLTAYERYMNAEDDSPEKQSELQAHIMSVRNNVSRLAKKAYTRYLPEGYNRLDFAFMYVPIDAALNLALLNDNTLWKEAYDQGVIILGPQTMYMNLRVLEMMWTQVRQLENQQTMIDCANTIVARVQDFASRFKDVDNAVHDIVRKFDKLNISIAPTGMSIITAAQKLVKAGAQEHRSKKSLRSASAFIGNEDSDESSGTVKELPAGEEDAS